MCYLKLDYRDSSTSLKFHKLNGCAVCCSNMNNDKCHKEQQISVYKQPIRHISTVNNGFQLQISTIWKKKTKKSLQKEKNLLPYFQMVSRFDELTFTLVFNIYTMTKITGLNVLHISMSVVLKFNQFLH